MTARGDQCENCTRVLDPVDLIDPRSAISGSTDIEIRDSTHLFLKQSQFVPQLREWIDGHKHDWPVLVTSIAYKWLDEGLHDRGITRDVEWGVPVPDDIADGQLKGKVFYVWFDAPIEYIAATKEWADANGKGDAWRDWWFGETPRTSPITSSWARTMCLSTRSAFPVTLLGLGRALEAGRSAEGLQLAELLRRQVLDLAASAASSWTRRSKSCRPITGAII